MVLEKTLESPLDSEEIKPVNPKGNKSWIFTGRTDAEAQIPILWPPDAKSLLFGKDPDAGKEWGKKGATEDEMVGWHHQLNRHEFEQTPGNSEGQGSLACCSPWDLRVGQDLVTEQQQHGWIHAASLLLLLLIHFSCVRLCVTPYMAAHQAPPSLGFSRHEHWSGLLFPSPAHESEKRKGSCSVVSDSSRPHGLQPTRLLRPWDLPGKSIGVGCHRLLRCRLSNLL